MRFLCSILQKIVETIHNLFKSRGAILVFHEIDDNMENCINSPNCWIKQTSFRNMIDEISKKNEIISIDRMFVSKSKNQVILTFDDIYENFYMYAYPILKDKKIPFTLFITTDRLDKNPYISTAQLIELANDKLCTVGSHSVSHKYFRKMSQEQLKIEANYSKEILSGIISKEIVYFAYPYGSFYASPNRYSKLLKTYNYKYAFSTLNTNLSLLSQRYYLPRININEDNYKKIMGRLTK